MECAWRITEQTGRKTGRWGSNPRRPAGETNPKSQTAKIGINVASIPCNRNNGVSESRLLVKKKKENELDLMTPLFRVGDYTSEWIGIDWRTGESAWDWRLGSRGLRHRHPVLQFFKPVQDDVDLGTRGLIGVRSVHWKKHDESIALGGDVIVPILRGN